MKLDKIDIEDLITDHKIISRITVEILQIISNAPADDNKEKYIHNYLDKTIFKKDLLDSFQRPVIVIYDEVLTVEILLAIHLWFIKQSCNIDNIFLVTTHTLGASEWYKKYLNLFGLRGFRLVEAPLMSRRYVDRFIDIPKKDIFSNKKIKHYFSYYGGSYPSLEKDFLVTVMLQLPNGCVEYMSGFSNDEEKLDNYLEELTGFCDRKTVDNLMNIRRSFVFTKNKTQTLNETFNLLGHQYQIDQQCAFQIIRETNNSTPFSCITEKTLRSFIHGQLPIPLSGKNSVNNIKKLGFLLDSNIIDYNYQYLDTFYERIQAVVTEVCRIQKNFSLEDLTNYINDNLDLIEYNYKYVASGMLFDTIKTNFLKQIND